MIEQNRTTSNLITLKQFVESDYSDKLEIVVSEAFSQTTFDNAAKAGLIADTDRAIFEQNNCSITSLLNCKDGKPNREIDQNAESATNSISAEISSGLFAQILDRIFSCLEEHSFIEASTMIEVNLLKYCFVKVALIDSNMLLDSKHYFRKFFARYVAMLLISKNNPALKEILRIASSNIVLEMPGLTEKTQLESLINQVSCKFEDAYKKLRDKSYLLERRTCESEYGKSISWAAKFWANRRINDLVERYSLPDFVLEMLHNQWSQLLYLDKLKNPNKTTLQSELTLQYLVASLTNVYEVSELEKLATLQSTVVTRLYERLSDAYDSQVKLDSFIDALKEQHELILSSIKCQVKQSAHCKQESPDIIRLYAGKASSSLSFESGSSNSLSPAQLEIWVEQLYEDRIPERSLDFVVYGESRNNLTNASSINLDEFLIPGCWYLIKTKGLLVSAKLSTKLEANSNYVFVDSKGLRFNAFSDVKLMKMIGEKEILALEETGLTETCIHTALNEVVGEINDRAFLKLQRQTLEAKKKLAAINEEKSKRERRRKFLEDNHQALKEATSEINNLSVGAWLKIGESDCQKRIKVGAILQSSKEVVLVDRNGFKIDQVKIKSLAEKVVKGECVLPKDDKLFDLSLR